MRSDIATPVSYGFSFQDFLAPFLSILFQALPFLLFGCLFAAFLETILPVSAIPRLLQKTGKFRYLFCAFAGSLFPLCECAALPIVRSLHRNGVSLSCCVIFLFSSPVVSPLCVISTWAAFQNQNPEATTFLRVVCVILIALCTGMFTSFLKSNDILSRLSAKDAFAAKLQDQFLATGFSQRLHHAVEEFLDYTCYLILGAALAAILSTGINRQLLFELGMYPSVSVGIMMTASVMLSLCSSSDAFIIAPILGIPWAAKLAFLIISPLIDIKLLVLYSTFFRKTFLMKISILFLLGTFLLAQLILLFYPAK